MLDLDCPVPQLAGLGLRALDRFARLLCEHLEQTVSRRQGRESTCSSA